MIKNLFLSIGLMALTAAASQAGVVRVGNGSYSDTFPGTDQAGRNGFPAAAPMLSGKALEKGAPTNEWYSNELTQAHALHIFNYPMALPPVDKGLAMINAIVGGATPADRPFTVGVKGVETKTTTISDYSDWGVTIRWANDAGSMDATILMGSPLVYFTKNSSNEAEIEITMGNAVIDGNKIYVSGSYNGASYAVYAPAGSTWAKDGNIFRSNLAGKNYWSAAMLPQNSDARAMARSIEPYAFVFPADTRADYTVDAATNTVTTLYKVTPDVKEGTETRFLMGLLPHHYGNLYGAAPEYVGVNYKTVRGELRMAAANEFTTSLRFSGVLPALPLAGITAEEKAELARLADKGVTSHGLQDWTDSYNDAQLINRLVQIAEAAKSAGDETNFKTAFDLVKQRVERWLQYAEGDVAFMFYYNKEWKSMLGYPAGHGQDTNINDHHFHWGYYIRGAAFIAQYDREWAEGWGEMINLLVRDAASCDRNDSMFPYLRNFSPYAGHSWADGTGSMPLGNNQESSSESMNFNTALILWGDVTGNKALRDLGVYLYATERSAIEEYWFDVNNRTMPAGYNHALICRVWGNQADFDNFWGGGPGGSYGIQIYPVNAGSFYLANSEGYAEKLWNAMSKETGILNFENNANIWYDTWLRMLAMTDSEKALELYNKAPQELLGAKFGESQAHTYQWLLAMEKLGKPAMNVTSDHPLAMAFENNGLSTYVARNNTAAALPVKFSDGHVMSVEPYSTGVETAGTVNPKVTLTASETSIKVGEEITFTADVEIPEGSDVAVKKVDFYVDNNLISTSTALPYEFKWKGEKKGSYSVMAIMTTTADGVFNSKTVNVTVDDENGVNPDPGEDPGTGDGEGCLTVSSEATEGSFNAPYTIKCESIDNNTAVKITAKFPGDYKDFAGPWLFNETSGFQEIGMTATGEERTYSATIGNLTAGTEISFRVKIAFAGGLAVTKKISYTTGKNCDAQTGIADLNVTETKVYPNPTTAYWNVESACDFGQLTLWTLDGRLCGKYHLEGGRAVIDATQCEAGIYLLHLAAPAGSTTVRVIKR